MLQQMGGYTNKGIKFVIISEKIWITEKKKIKYMYGEHIQQYVNEWLRSIR
jgi:ribosome biogenesis protein Nip4